MSTRPVPPVHAFALSDDYALLPLCYERGDALPPGDLTLTGVTADVTCQRCLQWVHA